MSQFATTDSGKLDKRRLAGFEVAWPHLCRLTVASAEQTPALTGIIERFEDLAANQPERVAIHDPIETVDYATLNARVNRIAHRLLAGGIGRNDLVAILMAPGVDWVTAVLAIFKAGAGYLPLYTGMPDARNQYCLDDSKARLLLTDRSHANRLAGNQAIFGQWMGE